MNDIKVLLVFPPLWIPYRPYLSLPSLSAYLKSNGINVVQKDFNIETYNLLLSKNYLERLDERLKSKFNDLDSKDRLTSRVEQLYYFDLFKAKSSIAYIAERIEEARGIFSDKQAFYDIDKLSNARSILEQAQAIFSLVYSPKGQDLMQPIGMQPQRSLKDVKKLTQNKDENPFIELYECHLLPFILEQNPDIIGISITSDSQLLPALTMSRLIKSRHKNIHVVVGGNVITLMSDVLIKHKGLFHQFFDSAVIYEGERPLLKLVERISHSKTLKDVPNLIYIDNGKIRVNEVLRPENINSLPTPCFDDLPLNLYLSPEPVLPILSSRGCYWSKCAFCSHNESYRWHYQSREAAKVVNDMQELSKKHGVAHFAFSDEAISPSSISKLSDELIKRGVKAKCSTNVRMERQFTLKLCNKMSKAGFKLLYCGLESGCNRILNHMSKGITKETAAEVFRNIHNAGIWSHVYAFFGFPTESRAEAQETIDFLLSNKNIIKSFYIGSFVLGKGSAIMKHPGVYGISSFDAGADTDFSLTYNHTVSSGLTSGKALELSNYYQEKIAGEYKTKKFFKLYYEDTLLYLSRFEGSGSCLLAPATEDKITKIQPSKQLTRKSVPMIKHAVVSEKLKFNIMDITDKIYSNEDVAAYPGSISVIIEPASNKIHRINPVMEDILALCDGRRSVQQIAHELSDKYDATRVLIENECIAFFKFLSEEGYVLF